ncbi:substrate-binding and VWA domain-containing protein [Actinoplanes aureus]|uniref:VWA domain-containing protein n=1 Tax=Actinoplanes aureus TaxID=2792083 RepID=A0A931CG09_9ACTN|nr:substrate-binding and VWA domain-containing protein [Actinoplanes aureus]MBG0567949.1 VWA domain-containing protein [Actinoplanes aureus]
MADGSLRARPEFWPVTLLSVALIAVLAGWAGFTYVDRTRSEPGCDERTTLRVVTAPSIAEPVRELADRFTERQRCLDVLVEGRESADVLRTIAGTVPVAATAPATASPSPSVRGSASASASAGPGRTATPAPDVWLPESTLWLRRARAVGAFQVPDDGVSVATTPVVLALDGASVTRLTRERRTLDWPGLVGAAKLPVAVSLPDPATSPLGFGALVGIRALAKSDPAGTVAIMRRLTRDTVSTAGEAVPDPTGPGMNEFSVISTEQQVLRNAAAGKRQVAVYPPAAVPGPDYPYAVLTSTGGGREVATAFLHSMLADDGATVFTENGLRTPAGQPPKSIPAATKVRTTDYPPAPLPDVAATEDLLHTWGGVHISARMLAVFDISGSMAESVPGSQETRMSATIKAAQDGSNLLLGTTELGVWEFSTDLDGARDYREVIPVGPIGPRRQQMLDRVGRIKVEPNGATGLYDTTLAAYRDGTRNWQPGKINMVLILTDGRDDNPDGISRARLLRELKGLVDPKRPLPILFIGVGPGVDKNELDQIAKVTGGQVALTAKPSGIRDIFYTSLAQFSCLPPECRR